MKLTKSTQVLRYFGAASTANTGVGAEVDALTFTATRRLLIRGWSFGIMGWMTGTPPSDERLTVCAEVTRALVRSTNFTMQHRNAMCQAVGVVGGTGSCVTHMERFLTEKEAEELGLVLDYGESITIAMCTTVAVGGNAAGALGGVFLYQEIY